MPLAAIWSSSQVDTPGATAAHTSSRISATARQASRSRRISSADLYLIRMLPLSTGTSSARWASSGATTDARALRAGEALVVARDEVRLDLLDRVERDADHDQETGAAEV